MHVIKHHLFFIVTFMLSNAINQACLFKNTLIKCMQAFFSYNKFTLINT
jgi:hypothetical protein